MTQRALPLEPTGTARARPDVRFIRRVVLKNYRSIAGCDLTLGELTFLVGPNGSGKSNFLDGLRLIGDALRTSLDHALRDRSGISEVRRRSGGHPTHFGVRVDFGLANGHLGHFAFEVGARSNGGFDVREEACTIGDDHYRVHQGRLVVKPAEIAPPASADRLYLVNAAGLPRFREVFDALSHMGFYNLNPDRMRALQTPDVGELLTRDGSNLASVLDRLARTQPLVKRRIEEYLAKVVPGIDGVDAKRVGHMETVEFRQRVEGQKDAWRFPAINMSDGTLRALGILIALFQHAASESAPLVGIEEPEVALHPAAAGVLLDALREGSRQVQVLVTSHSPDLLDDPNIDSDAIIAVTATEGRSALGAVDEATRSALRDRLYTAGELLRTDQLRPDAEAIASAEGRQLKLFESGDAE